MIEFSRFELDNGLRVVLHEDHSTPMVAVNILYNVGARDESPDKTGFAHLFETFDVWGDLLIYPNFDEPIQMAGGEIIMHLQTTTLQIFMTSCLLKILRLLFGWNQIEC